MSAMAIDRQFRTRTPDTDRKVDVSLGFHRMKKALGVIRPYRLARDPQHCKQKAFFDGVAG
jgi:hypothetical protein